MVGGGNGPPNDNGSSQLRELVTGSDSCDASGSGRNAVSSLADALFRGRAGYRQQIGQANGLGIEQQPLERDAVDRALNAPLPYSNHGFEGQGGLDVNEFLQSQSKGKEVVGEAGFDDIYAAAAAGAMGHQMGPVEQTGPILHAFLHNQRGLPVAMGLNVDGLNVQDKCHVRDRSTILARQLFADQGEEYIHQHLDELMRSLRIDPAALPTSGESMQRQWDGIYDGAGTSVALEHAEGLHGARQQMRESGWADEFSKKMTVSDAWVAEHESKANGWVHDFEKHLEEDGNSTQRAAGVDVDPSISSVSAMEHTKRLADTLSAETDPKFKHSKFLQFVSKMSRGEIIVDGNEVKEVPKESAAWASEFVPPIDHHFDQAARGTDWADEFANKMGSNWAEEFEHAAGQGDWTEEYLQSLEKATVFGQSGYRMSENNPFLGDMDSFTKGRKLFQQGLLSQAVLAIEAECQRNPGNSEAWKLLGTVQAENDDDIQAIAAMNRALACDPNNTDVLLSLGVSHTNEFDQKAAVGYLRQWLGTHPRYRDLVQNDPGPPDSSQNLSYTINLFKTATTRSHDDADVYAALGVLCNLARQYGDAVEAFRHALNVNPKDYSLWNKLGATLANSSRSGEALDAYRRALELKPNYMRAWTNMGISLANLGQYEESSKYYVRALTLNKDSSTVWAYLRTSLICGARDDLLGFADDNNLEALRQALPL